MSRSFTPRAVAKLLRRNAIPSFLTTGWLKGTDQNVGVVVGELIYQDQRRKLQGFSLGILTLVLVGVVFYAGEHANLQSNRFTHQYTTKEMWSGAIFIVGMIAAFCTGFGSFFMVRFPPMEYWDFEKEGSFGWNLATTLSVLGNKLEELNAMDRHVVWSIADQLLVIAAKNVLLAERAIKKRFEGDYRKPEWKYEPEWDKAKKYFEQIYYMFERFDLADPNGFDSYYDRARDELWQEELKQKA